MDSMTRRNMSRGIDARFGTIFTPYGDAVDDSVLAIPIGFTAASRPLSLQLPERLFGEATLVRVGDA
jgi:Asp-tRNA(Asn)/Glu-tRNA(Gln) amidotransferase A subunit family amidase